MPFDSLAFDAGARTYDLDGRLHVRVSHISKACVSPYRGSEIPNSAALGLEPDRVYQLLRDPEELVKSVPTWNGVQLLIKHTPVSADDPQHDKVVGSLGTNAAWREPYLDNSITIWDGEAITGVETGEQRQLSGGYHYRADMTPGMYQGTAFDGVMRDIRGNHVALVRAGRAGADVMVMDAAFSEGDHPRGEGGQFEGATSKHYPKNGVTEHARVVQNEKPNYGKPGSGKKVERIYEHHSTGEVYSRGANGHSRKHGSLEEAARHLGWKPKTTHDDKTFANDERKSNMVKKVATVSSQDLRKAVQVRERNAAVLGALHVYLPPKLASGQKMPDLRKLVAGAATGAVVADRVTRATQGMLAQDADLKDLSNMIDGLKGPEMRPDDGEVVAENPLLPLGDPEDTNIGAKDDDIEEKVRELLAGKLDDADLELLLKLIRPEETAEDPPAPIDESDDPPPVVADPDDDDDARDRLRRGRDAMPPQLRKGKDAMPAATLDKVSRPAMDAAISAAVARVEARGKAQADRAVADAIAATTKRLNARDDAEKFVRPWIGEIALAMDTAEDVYRLALDTLNVGTDGVHPSAFRAILSHLPKPGDVAARPARMAQDAANVTSLEARFPGLKNARVVG